MPVTKKQKKTNIINLDEKPTDNIIEHHNISSSSLSTKIITPPFVGNVFLRDYSDIGKDYKSQTIKQRK